MIDRRAAPLRQLIHRVLADRLFYLNSPTQSYSALFAPAAMAMFALGLLGLWTLSGALRPIGPALRLDTAGVFDAPSSGADDPVRTAAVLQAAQANARGLNDILTGLGAQPQTMAVAAVTNGAGATTAQATLAHLRASEEHSVRASDAYARSELTRLHRALRMAGIDGRTLSRATTLAPGLSRLELGDTRVLAARFDLDRSLARQTQRAVRDLLALRILQSALPALPFGLPVDFPVRSSGFGMRTDPFTHLSAFHPGQDFAGRLGDLVRTTAPGVVAFAGQRSGYGNCIEVDHGHGFKTRYGHLSRIEASVGQAVTAGDVVGLMGSTGRSTGVHLHYEVWRDGHLNDPAPFLSAGETLRRASVLQVAAATPSHLRGRSSRG